MANSTVSVNFSASIGDLLSGVADAKTALASLSEPAQALTGQYQQLRESISTTFETGPLKAYGDSLNQLSSLEKLLETARTQAAAALRNGDETAYRDAARAAQAASRDEIQADQDALKQKLASLTEQERLHQITTEQGVQLARSALDQEYAAEAQFLQQSEQLGSLSLTQKEALLRQQLDARQAISRSARRPDPPVARIGISRLRERSAIRSLGLSTANCVVCSAARKPGATPFETRSSN